MKRLLAIFKSLYIRNQYNELITTFKIFIDSMKYYNLSLDSMIESRDINETQKEDYKKHSSTVLSSIQKLESDFTTYIKIFNHSNNHKL